MKFDDLLYHFVAIVIIGCVIGTGFTLTYPGFGIDSSLALLFALAAIIIEGLGFVALQKLARRQ